MTEITVRNVDDNVARVLRARAEQRGISLAEEVRQTLAASVTADRADAIRRARALHAAAGGKPGKPGTRQRADNPQSAGCLGLELAAACNARCK